MTTDELTTPAAQAAAADAGLAIDPASGEVINLTEDSTPSLVAAEQRVRALVAELGRYRQSIVDEVAHRLDKLNRRSDDVGEWVIETNPPATDEYLIDVLRDEFTRLAKADVVDDELVRRIIRKAPPKPPEPKVDKREINKLKSSEDRRILVALAKARQRKPNTRTLTVKAKAEAKR